MFRKEKLSHLGVIVLNVHMHSTAEVGEDQTAKGRVNVGLKVR